MIVCNQVLKYILDKIDKEEKQAAKKRKREESVEQKRSKQNATKLSALLFKHKEQLKAEILKKRALLDKDLQIEVQVKLTFTLMNWTCIFGAYFLKTRSKLFPYMHTPTNVFISNYACPVLYSKQISAF